MVPCTDDTWKVAEILCRRFCSGSAQGRGREQAGFGLCQNRRHDSRPLRIPFFVDDDNWVIPEWVEIVHHFFFHYFPRRAPSAEKASRSLKMDPARNGWRLCRFYGRRPQYDEPGDITTSPPIFSGERAGHAQSVFEKLMELGFEFICTERLGPELFTLVSMRPVEDTDLCYGIRALGWRLYYAPALSYKHFLTKIGLPGPILGG